ncbi:hypothetical protein ASG40_11395 [Methylobacterium sp. Leaf399]|uniref:hypothetical protein n=1 Tax=unclassified Methylobacterium TaxID=2615210 RepID=UPI00071422BD|nr:MULTISPECIES: hypothetical protein [unclassified Methylobacterium]KQP54876.1 hypothetical protein ASF39_03720 [Methylobacterium sp. Leaf108]KQT09228.1 hypothetical protein ASG40_11395 [Methylobacterium sp. Leaf399]
MAQDVFETGASIGMPAYSERPDGLTVKIIRMDDVCSVDRAGRAASLADAPSIAGNPAWSSS